MGSLQQQVSLCVRILGGVAMLWFDVQNTMGIPLNEESGGREKNYLKKWEGPVGPRKSKCAVPE